MTRAALPFLHRLQFYFAHRLLHFGPIYKQVHSLHHRNTDIEPFAGLCMHPIEHLYYYGELPRWGQAGPGQAFHDAALLPPPSSHPAHCGCSVHPAVAAHHDDALRLPVERRPPAPGAARPCVCVWGGGE